MKKCLTIGMISILMVSNSSVFAMKSNIGVLVHMARPRSVPLAILAYNPTNDTITYKGPEASNGCVFSMNDQDLDHLQIQIFEQYYNYMPPLSRFNLIMRNGTVLELFGIGVGQKKALLKSYNSVTVEIDKEGKARFRD